MMINIGGKQITDNEILNSYELDKIEKVILEQLIKSNYLYEYTSIEELLFEIRMRNRIIEASKDLNRSKFEFTVFRESRCNEQFWNRTDEGGFLIRDDVSPYKAVMDIYDNSSDYGTECATAMVIVFIKAVLDMYPEDLFNKTFANLYLMNWLHIDEDLGIRYYRSPADYLPGDCRYFDNPDVNPLTPELQGENVIDLGDGKYYGHGIGIQKPERIIKFLNDNRISEPTKTAYLVNSATRPDFKHLYDLYYSYNLNLENFNDMSA